MSAMCGPESVHAHLGLSTPSVGPIALCWLHPNGYGLKYLFESLGHLRGWISPVFGRVQISSSLNAARKDFDPTINRFFD